MWKIHRRNHGDQVFNIFRMKGRIHQAEGSPLADAQDVDLACSAFFSDVFDTVIDIDIDIVI